MTMMPKRAIRILSTGLVLLLFTSALFGCQAMDAEPTTESIEATIVATEDLIAPEETQAEEEPAEAPGVLPTPDAVEPTPGEEEMEAEEEESAEEGQEDLPLEQEILNSLPEERSLDLEWPEEMWLGEADVIILSLVPAGEAYVFEAEFSDHSIQSEPVTLPSPEGYILWAKAHLDAPGFSLASDTEQQFQVHREKPVIWRWSLMPKNSGRQRINISAQIILEPPAGVDASLIEHTLLSESLEIQVRSILGLPRGTARILLVILLAILFSLGVLLLLFFLFLRPRSPLRILKPDPDLQIEGMTDRPLDRGTHRLMAALFGDYARIIITSEFQSGYSGARTWLVMPIRKDGRHDAQTIVKVGAAPVILSEYRNYEDFVKDTLPPMTARIQDRPVSTRGEQLAALRYTFIGLSGQHPLSLRQALLENPDPAHIQRLFETFGPNWWCQRSPATFRLAVAYDSILPSHLALRPTGGKGRPIDGADSQGLHDVAIGEVVTLKHFPVVEKRADGQSFSLENEPPPGHPPTRIRWMAPAVNDPLTGVVIGTRWSILEAGAAGKNRFDLPDPLAELDQLLQTTLHGSKSIIHGDLNLENILIGPGDMVWLIDFARTRKGPPLIDFTHLYGEIVAQVIAQGEPDPARYLATLREDGYPLLSAVDGIGRALLPTPRGTDAYDLPLIVTCLGMLKFPNLSDHARHLLYLTAAWKISQR